MELGRLGQLLPNDCLDIFMSVKAPTVTAELTVKSAYNSLVDSNNNSAHARLHKGLWKIKARQGLKTLMWVVVNDALLANHACMRRGLVTQDTCFLLCGYLS